MNYRFLAQEQIKQLFDDTEYTVGQIMRTVLHSKNTGCKATDLNCIENMTDKEWYESLEKAYEDTLEDYEMSDEKWEEFLNRATSNV